jgi:hypothetical protein
MGIDGSDPRHILETSSSSFQFTTTMSFIQDFTWQPETNNIILSLCTNIFEGNEYYGDCQQVDLLIVDTLTGEAKSLTTTETAKFTLSPDGSWLTVQRIDGIDLINTNKVNVQKDVLSYPRIVDYTRSARSIIPNVSWSRDSRMFYVAIPSPGTFIDYQTLSPDARVSLYKVQVDGELEQLSTISGAFIFDNNIDLGNIRPTATAFSPDGRFVMMLGRTLVDEEIALRLYSTEGEEIAVLHATMIEGWGWSPDSTQYAFGGIGEGGMLVDTSGNVLAFTPTVSTVSQFSWMAPETMTFLGYVQDVGYRVYFLQPGNAAEVLMEFEDDIQFDPWWEGGRSLR